MNELRYCSCDFLSGAYVLLIFNVTEPQLNHIFMVGNRFKSVRFYSPCLTDIL